MPSLTRTACLLLLATTPAFAQTPIVSLDARNLEPATGACVDFYQHANGGWLKANPIPGGFASWGTFEEMGLQSLLRQRGLMETPVAADADAAVRALGWLYGAGMDEAAIEAAGIAPLQPLLARIDQIKKPKDIAPALADLHMRGIPALFDFGLNDDLNDPSIRILYANQGGLGMPDRDYYLREDEATKNLMKAYRGYVERLLTLTGSQNPAADSATVLKVETQLARASLTLLQLRDPNNSWRPIGVKELAKRFPNLKWADYLKRQGIPKLASLSLAHETFFRAADGLIVSLPPDQWRAYLKFHAAHTLAPYLSSGFVQAHEAMYLRTLRGSQEPMPRWRRVLGTVDTLLPQALGQHYLSSEFPQARREAAQAMIDALRATLRTRLETAPWLASQARVAALAKLDALDVKLGGPATMLSYAGLDLSRGVYGDKVLATTVWLRKLHMAAAGKPREDWQWPQPPQAVNLYYDPARNQLVVPAGIVQAPLFDPAADAAVNYGGLGTLIAHELFHGFDVIGSGFDAQGRLETWWQPADKDAFTTRTQALEIQYDAYKVLGQVPVSGRLTLAENIADLAGVQIAWDAFQQTRPDAAAKIGGQTPAQRFFLAYAQDWRRNYQDTELQLLSRIDVHAPAPFRVNGPLANFTPFAETFACKDTQTLTSEAAAAAKKKGRNAKPAPVTPTLVKPQAQRVSVFQ